MTLQEIQQNLKVPKNLHNNFGDYNYRNGEGILEAVKPMLGGSVLMLTDEMVEIGGRIYVKAIARFIEEDGKYFETIAYAREDESKKGMDLAQLTGACSSYARKYALSGLFLLDDTKDADSQDNRNLPPKNENKGESDIPTTNAQKKVLSGLMDKEGFNDDVKKEFYQYVMIKDDQLIAQRFIDKFSEYLAAFKKAKG